jgi:hypothetical protein
MSLFQGFGTDSYSDDKIPDFIPVTQGNFFVDFGSAAVYFHVITAVESPEPYLIRIT